MPNYLDVSKSTSPQMVLEDDMLEDEFLMTGFALKSVVNIICVRLNNYK